LTQNVLLGTNASKRNQRKAALITAPGDVEGSTMVNSRLILEVYPDQVVGCFSIEDVPDNRFITK
jgi:hypothetical protein